MRKIKSLSVLLVPMLLLANMVVFAQNSPFFPDNIDSVTCSFSPPVYYWGIIKETNSAALSHLYAQPFVGDIDNDGHSEIVSIGYYESPFYSSSIVIYDDQLQHLTTIITPIMYVYGGYPLTIADVDRDGFAEIFVHDDSGYLHCYRFDGTLSSLVWTTSSPTITGRSPNMIVADINSDSIPEIWAMNKIFNSITGTELLSMSEVIGCSDLYNGGHAAMPVFADFDNDGVLELVGGNKAFKINITNSDSSIGNSIILWKIVTDSSVGDGLTSVADIDLDGFLDVVVVQSNSMYVWNPYSGEVSSPLILASVSYSSSSPGSRALLTDVNNDSYPEILFTYVEKIISYRYDPYTQTLLQMWQKSTSDTSGATTMTAFDFNQDGVIEIVYRDQSLLRIIDGNTGNNHATFECVAPTAVEYPVIVDLDRNGQAEIIASSSNFDNNHDMHANFIVYKSPPNTNWAPARYVWNQHAYNVVGINNDLTVPAINFNPAIVFIDPENNIRRPFNNFLQQATTLDQYGRPYIAAADATAVSANITTNSSNVTLDVTYTNQGDNTLKAPYSITVFANQLGGEVIQTITVNTPLIVGETEQQSIILPLYNLCQLSSLVVAINCAGGGIAQDGGLQSECDLTNNTASVSINLQNEPTYISETACDQFEWNGNNYTQSGEYEATLTNSFGCDSIVNLNLTINHSDTMSFNVSSCESYLWNEQTYTSSGIYTYITTNEFGCNRTEILDLDITSSSLSIQGKTSIYPSTDITSGIYQYHIDSIGIYTANVHWSIDREDWLLFPKGASCDLVCTSEGQAVLRAWTEGELCDVDTTMVLNASFYTIGENEMQSAIVYPNPTNGSVTISWHDIVAIKVFNLLGQIIDEHKFEKQDKVELDMQDFQKAVYVLEISTSDRKVYKSVILSK